MLTSINFTTSSAIKCPLASSKQSFKAAAFFHTFRHLITTSIIVIILANAIQPGDNVANAEYFSSVDSLQKLGDVEIALIQAFRDYLQLQDLVFESYQKFVEHIKLQHSMANEDVEDYVGNPINAFTLIKRMVTDWTALHDFIKNNQAQSDFRKILDGFKEKKEIPDYNDLKGAITGLIRLQQVYNLKANDLANGRINNVYSGTELSWNDCFEIAVNLFDEKEFSLALTWFQIVKEKLYKNKSNYEDAILRKFEIETLEYMALSLYEMGDSEEAIEYIDEILKLVPDHHTKDVLIYIINSQPKQSPPSILSDKYSFNRNYTRLCRGIQIPQKKLRTLKCTLESRGNPQLILAPLKIEQLSKDPEVTLYHGLLTDVQIDRIIAETEGHMFRSLIGNATHITTSDERISQQAWLSYTSPVMRSIYRLMEQVTGLSMFSSEIMQMANYGIGGQYDAHFDFISPVHEFTHFFGSRISTNMFYLSDVEQGGFTVFPHINVYVRPEKGSLVSWYNLHKSLDPDLRALHAGCPVISGSKRIGNIWIHSGFQEFLRPCGLKSDTYKSEVFKDVAKRYFK